MNERIRELVEQANIHFSRIGILDGDPDGTARSVGYSKVEKFAELIVRECIGCCEQVISDPVPESVDTWLNGGEQCIDQIKQHFGVEE